MRRRSPVTMRGMSSSQPLAVHASRRSVAGRRHQCTPGSLTDSTYVEPDRVLTMTTDRMWAGTPSWLAASSASGSWDVNGGGHRRG